jgi:hypothetical protein
MLSHLAVREGWCSLRGAMQLAHYFGRARVKLRTSASECCLAQKANPKDKWAAPQLSCGVGLGLIPRSSRMGPTGSP